MRIWLHIGLQKTGTSALQQWMAEHRSELAKAGLLYLQVKPGHSNVGPLYRALLKRPLEAEQMIAALRHEVESHPHAKDAVISCEDFSQSDPQLVAPLLAAFARHELIIVLWIRRQDRLAEALLKQAIKFHAREMDVETFLRGNLTRVLNYDKLLQNWAEAFPQAQLRPQVYEEPESGQKADSIGDFLRILGYTDVIPAQSEDYRLNITPAAELVALYGKIDCADPRILRRANRKFMEINGQLATGRDDLFSSDLSESLLRSYEASNALVAKKWFPERSRLFAPRFAQATKQLAPAVLIDFESLLQTERKKHRQKKQ